ncbi:MAG: hypothetical protein ACYCST_09640 [Acidimicrobiales bacterium]
MTELPALDATYIAARRVLLDALVALAAHDRAVIVAGAQAIYLRTGSADLTITVAPFTTDGDLALDPRRLEDDPQLEDAMTDANFELRPQGDGRIEPGIWTGVARVGGQHFEIPVDLIVPEAVAPKGGRRGARLGVHGNRAARRAVGLEAALVDHGLIQITALEAGDDRQVVANVAGEAALLVAKMHKLHDRVASGRSDRLDDKDAADVIRLMQASSPRTVGLTIASLCSDDLAGAVSGQAVGYLDELFGRRGRVGIRMAASALRFGLPEERVEALSVAYAGALIDVVRGEISELSTEES